ncbi:hypothetical protein [Paraburkholderia youngii]|uniref:hypothetical protein n=1 Tax=Paraburkholderia youngii TaxID=2782701 RepID=UPI003D25BD33
MTHPAVTAASYSHTSIKYPTPMITRKPWIYGSSLIGRDYLQQDGSFAALVKEMADALSQAEQSVVCFHIDPKSGKYKDPLLKHLKCKRPSWRISLAPALLDAFFNGRMGIRAQYYASPYEGPRMNQLLISTLRDRLIEFALRSESHSQPKDWLVRSLAMASAKAWISETTADGHKIIRAGDSHLVEDELQNDWLDLARSLKAGGIVVEDHDRFSAALQGVRCPIADQLLIQGAWLTEEGLYEYVTPDKRDRDCQLFMFGYT